MKLIDLVHELEPANSSQDDYEVKIAPSDDSDGDLWPIEEIEWNHHDGIVMIRMGYLEDES